MRQCVCVLRVSCVCRRECRPGLVSGLLSDSGVNNTLSLLLCVCVCVCAIERAREGERESTVKRWVGAGPVV